MRTRRASSVGPRKRDYYHKLQGQVNAVTYYSGGIAYKEVYPADWITVSLKVNNPWRATKPRPLGLTARTLEYLRIQAPHLEVFERTNDVWSTLKRGPVNDCLAAEYNKIYLALRDRTYFTVNEQLRTEAILDCMQKVKDQKWNAGVTLAESSGVAKMVTDACELVTATRRALREKDFVGAYRRFRAATGYMSYSAWKRKYRDVVKSVKSTRNRRRVPTGWLYYHFGIKPTIDDITGAVEAHQTKLVDLLYGRGLVVRGYAKHTVKHKGQSLAASGMLYEVDRNILHSVRVTVSVYPKSEMLARLSGLGVTNPPEAVYNGMPFSWVLDYLTTTGDWLSALDTSLAWNFGEFWSEAWRTTAESKVLHLSNSRFRVGSASEFSGIRLKMIDRVVRGDLYGPMGSVLPTFKRRGPSLQQISNLLSVLATSFKSTIRP